MSKRKKYIGRVTENFWNEVKKLNWKKINKESLMKFKINFIGDNESFSSFINTLEKSEYDLFNLKIDRVINLTSNARGKIHFIDIKDTDDNDCIEDSIAVISSKIIMVDSRYIRKIQEQEKIKKYYTFNLEEVEDIGDIFEQILSDNEKLGPALSYNYPAFRTTMARKKISEIAKQNALWAAGSSVANIIPGPQQLITAPLEAASDFTVLTANEIRMVFISAGLCGRKVEPLKLIPEFMIMLGGAKGAQILATQTIGKVPAGAGNILKATIAYAFTFAIGEAVFLNMNYGIKVDKKKIKERMKVLTAYSKNIVTKFMKKKKDEENEESIN